MMISHRAHTRKHKTTNTQNDQSLNLLQC